MLTNDMIGCNVATPEDNAESSGTVTFEEFYEKPRLPRVAYSSRPAGLRNLAQDLYCTPLIAIEMLYYKLEGLFIHFTNSKF